MPTIREAQQKLRALPEQPKERPVINHLSKYVTPQSVLFERDAGVCGDKIPDGYVVFTAFGVEFLVKQTLLKNPNVMWHASVRKFLEDLADRHKNRTMYVCVNAQHDVCVCSALSARFYEEERFRIDGTEIVAEKGVYDAHNSQDVKWLLNLVERFKKQRVMLISENDLPVDLNIRNNNAPFVGHCPE